MSNQFPHVDVAAPIHAQVSDAIREQIISQQFAPGKRLIERELCTMTGASRASVREALRQLESEGLVIAIPKRGIVVAQVSLEDALHIYAVRAVLEGLIAATFAERASDEHRERLFTEAERLATATDIRTILRVKSDLFKIMFEGAQNSVAEQLLGSLQARVSLMRTKSLSADGRPIESAREISQLVEAIRARDADAASAAARFHVRQAARALEHVLLEEMAALSSHSIAGPVDGA